MEYVHSWCALHMCHGYFVGENGQFRIRFLFFPAFVLRSWLNMRSVAVCGEDSCCTSVNMKTNTHSQFIIRIDTSINNLARSSSFFQLISRSCWTRYDFTYSQDILLENRFYHISQSKVKWIICIIEDALFSQEHFAAARIVESLNGSMGEREIKVMRLNE